MRVILNLGMGVDSSAIAFRWLTEPETRDFPVDRLTVVSAMTGNEFEDTRSVMERHMLPLFREHGVRYVQLARNGHTKQEGITVLSDTRQPSRLHLEGVYSLWQELTEAGTGPQVASRRCSIKFKGWPIDTWLGTEVTGPFRQVMGFNADEQRRITRDGCYGGDNRNAEYPLMAWGWGRERCEQYLLEKAGEPWPKSCCSFCPFTRGKEGVIERYRRLPQAAAEALLLEVVAMALNPRMTLYAHGSLWSALAKDHNTAAFDHLFSRAQAMEWGLYRVRRVYTAKGRADRSVEVVSRGSRGKVSWNLTGTAGLSGRKVLDGYTPRFYVLRREENVYPSVEEMFVAAPLLAAPKARPSFEKNWGRVALATT